MALDEVLDLLRPGSQRRRERRTREAAVALAERRLAVAWHTLLDLGGPELAERIDVRRPRGAEPAHEGAAAAPHAQALRANPDWRCLPWAREATVLARECGPDPARRPNESPMTFISVTRLRLRSRLYYPLFLWHALRSALQARRAQGFLGGWLGGDPERGKWTASVWIDEAAMRAYRNAGAHQRAMPRLLEWCDEASFARWTADAAQVPTGEVAFEHMQTLGRSSKVRRPSTLHAAGQAFGPCAPRVSTRLRPSDERHSGPG